MISRWVDAVAIVTLNISKWKHTVILNRLFSNFIAPPISRDAAHECILRWRTFAIVYTNVSYCSWRWKKAHGKQQVGNRKSHNFCRLCVICCKLHRTENCRWNVNELYCYTLIGIAIYDQCDCIEFVESLITFQNEKKKRSSKQPLISING